MDDFALKWRWDNTHNPNISISEMKEIQPLSEVESKRINKIIDYFENEYNLKGMYQQTDWISATAESDEKIERFRNQLSSIIEKWNDGVIITWNRSTTLRTTKSVFLKYWDDFCYPSSDNVTVISEDVNWIMFYNHIEVVKVWTRK